MTSIPPQKFRFHLLHLDNLEKGNTPVLIKMWFPKQQRYDLYADGAWRPPNNYNATTEKYNRPEDKYIPKFDDTHCANYFDPNTGHLYLLIKDSATCDIKTEPVVVLKLGI